MTADLLDPRRCGRAAIPRVLGLIARRDISTETEGVAARIIPTSSLRWGT